MSQVKFKDKNGNLQDIGFIPTPGQMSAIDSGISASKVQQIEQNQSDILTKQDILESGQNIKTINNESILGAGNVNIGAKEMTTLLPITVIDWEAVHEMNLTTYISSIIFDDYKEIYISFAESALRLNFNFYCLNPQYFTMGTIAARNHILCSIPFYSNNNLLQNDYTQFIGKATLMFRFVNRTHQLFLVFEGLLYNSTTKEFVDYSNNTSNWKLDLSQFNLSIFGK